MKFLGIDFGMSRIGLAVSDDGGNLAFPLEIVKKSDALERIETLVKEKGVTHIVFGHSLALSREENTVQKNIDAFMKEVARVCGIVPQQIDERYTSKLAELNPGAKKRPPQTRIRGKGSEAKSSEDDAQAAALILQTYLNRYRINNYISDEADNHTHA